MSETSQKSTLDEAAPSKPSELCKNCGHLLDGPYCSQCGLKVVDRRDRTLRKILTDFIASLFLVENKAFRSLKGLLFAPARLPRTYIAGNTIRYVRPIQFFLLANLIYYLAPQIDTFNTNYNTQMHGLPYSAWIYPKVQSHLQKKGTVEQDFERQFDRTSSQLAKLIVILLAPMMGFLLWILHAKRRQFYAGDHIAVALYILTFIVIVMAVLLPIALRVGHWFFPGLELTEQFFSILVISAIALYVTLILHGVYRQGTWVATAKGICFAVFFIPFLHLFRFILLIATLGIIMWP